MKISGIILTLALLIACNSKSQDSTYKNIALNYFDYPVFMGLIDTNLTTKYPFIHFEKNVYRFYTEESENFDKLFFDFQQMILKKDRKLNFYHIGGSHLQADVHSHQIRTYFQQTWEELPGERGWVFPYDLIKTNTPGNYDFKSKNEWKSYRCVSQRPDSLDYGLLGGIVECSDSIIQLEFEYKKTKVKPGFDKIKIYHNKGVLPYELNFGEDEIYVIRKQTNPEVGYTEIHFTDQLQKFEMYFIKDQKSTSPLRLYGVHLSNKEPGISYNSIGINGASLPSYLKNKMFFEQLTELPPDLFVFSVGTNDANVPYSSFKPEIYLANLDSLIQIVLKANTNCAILLTVPNDAFFKKKYLNKNVAREREMIIALARKHQAAVWDFYGIMGELGSARTWSKNLLMRKDLVHFTHKGYELKGELFFEAYLKFLLQMSERQKEIYQLNKNGKN